MRRRAGLDTPDLRGQLLELLENADGIVDVDLPLRQVGADETELELCGHRDHPRSPRFAVPEGTQSSGTSRHWPPLNSIEMPRSLYSSSNSFVVNLSVEAFSRMVRSCCSVKPFGTTASMESAMLTSAPGMAVRFARTSLAIFAKSPE